jgi:hypothetical protein
VTKEQHQQLRNLLSLTYNSDIVAKQYPLVRQLEEQMRVDLLDDDGVEELLKAASDLYCLGSGDDIEVDEDAPLSRTDNGTWVGGWLWVPHPDEDDDAEEAKQVTAAETDDQGGSSQEGAQG